MESPTAVLYTRERTLEVSIPRMCIQVVSWQLLPIEYPIIGIQYKLYKYSSASCGDDCRERRESKPKKPMLIKQVESYVMNHVLDNYYDPHCTEQITITIIINVFLYISVM